MRGEDCVYACGTHMITDHRNISEVRQAGCFSPFTLGIQLENGSSGAVGLHELIHFSDFVSSFWGQNVINQSRLVAQETCSSCQKLRAAKNGFSALKFPLMKNELKTIPEAIRVRVENALRMFGWLYGSPYNSVSNLKLTAYSEAIHKTVHAGFSLLPKPFNDGFQPELSAPHIEGIDLNGSPFSFRPGLLHLLESRAQMANFYYLRENNPDDIYALTPRMKLIFNEPEGFAYGAVLSFVTKIWGGRASSGRAEDNGGPNLFFASVPAALFAYAALLYWQGPEEHWGQQLARADIAIQPIGNLDSLYNQLHPFEVFARLCVHAQQNWFTGDWENFPELWQWINEICKSATKVTLVEMMAKFRNSLEIALERSPSREVIDLYPLMAGLKIVEMLESDPQCIISPQKMFKSFLHTEYMPFVSNGGRHAWGLGVSTDYTMRMSVFERALWGGTFHSGSLSATECSAAKWCVFDQFDIGREFHACQTVFSYWLGSSDFAASSSNKQ
jgi:hypothetical protein